MSFIQRLADGLWLFDEIMPAYLAKLSASYRLAFLGGRKVPAYVTTLAYYRVLPEADILAALENQNFDGRAPSSRSGREVWNQLAQLVEKDCSAIDYEAPEMEKLLGSWDELTQLDQSHGCEFGKVVSAMVPLEGSDFGAASTPRLLGCLFITRTWLELPFEKRMTSLVHELAHQELFVINLTDRLVNSDADFSLVHAPLQGAMRPPIGRLHAAHALYRMRQFQRRVGWPCQESERLLEETCGTFAQGDLTPFAAELVKDVYRR